MTAVAKSVRCCPGGMMWILQLKKQNLFFQRFYASPRDVDHVMSKPGYLETSQTRNISIYIIGKPGYSMN